MVGLSRSAANACILQTRRRGKLQTSAPSRQANETSSLACAEVQCAVCRRSRLGCYGKSRRLRWTKPAIECGRNWPRQTGRNGWLIPKSQAFHVSLKKHGAPVEPFAVDGLPRYWAFVDGDPGEANLGRCSNAISPTVLPSVGMSYAVTRFCHILSVSNLWGLGCARTDVLVSTLYGPTAASPPQARAAGVAGNFPGAWVGQAREHPFDRQGLYRVVVTRAHPAEHLGDRFFRGDLRGRGAAGSVPTMTSGDCLSCGPRAHS